MKIAFIGFGNMAQAIIKGIKIRQQDELYIASPTQSATRTNQVVFTPDNLTAIEQADLILLCVKPAIMATVLNEIGQHLPLKSVLISIAAGTTLRWMQQFCRPEQTIVRCMPNTPIAVGMGATPFCANQPLTLRQKKRVESLFNSASLITWLTNESDINAYTALSGSGPAYVFLFIEALIDGAKQLGLSEKEAMSFSLQTIRGAVTLLKQSRDTPEALRKKVSSRGGTTEAALSVLQAGGFHALIMKAMDAAYKRAINLGNAQTD